MSTGSDRVTSAAGRSPRAVAVAGGITGLALILCLAFPYASTGFMALFGTTLAGPNPDGDMFHGLGLGLAWAGATGIALLLVIPLAVATLVLDVLTVIRAIRSRAVLGARLIPLAAAWVVGTGVVTTLVLLVIGGQLRRALGETELAEAFGVLVFAAVFLLPFLGRAAQLVLALRLRRSPGLALDVTHGRGEDRRA